MSDSMTLLVWLVKATTLLVLAMGVTVALRRAPAGARYLVWLATLVAILLVPAISSWAPLSVPVLPAPRIETGQPAASPSVGAARAPAAAPVATPVTTRPSATSASTDAPLSIGRILLAAWALVGLGLATWLLIGAYTVRRIVRRGRVLADASWLSPMYDVADRLDLEQAPRLVMSSAIEMPFACGIMTPTIVLPMAAEGWSEERRRVVLFHELAHVRRRDLLGHTLGRIVCAMYWFHPLVWSAAKRLRAESERACDDLVLACGGARASDYASHLLEIVTAVRFQGAPATALPMANKREFEGRMLAILDPDVRRTTPSRAQNLTLAAGLALVSLSIAAVAPARRAATPDDVSRQASALPGGDTAVEEASVPASPSPGRRATTAPSATSPASPTVSRSTSARTTQSTTTSTTTDAIMRQLTRRGGVTARLGVSEEEQQQVDTALLARILRTDRDAGVRKAATWVLRGHRAGIPLLVERLRGDESGEVREMAAWGLADGGSEVIAPLSAALEGDRDHDVRATSAWALGHFGDDAPAEPLLAALADPSADVRERALWALGHQHLSSAPPTVSALLTDEQSSVRLMAAWLLGEIQDKSTIPAIRAAFVNERHSEVLQAEFRALIFMGDRSQAMIDRALSHEDPEIRARAVRVMAGQGAGVWPWPWPWPDPRPEP